MNIICITRCLIGDSFEIQIETSTKFHTIPVRLYNIKPFLKLQSTFKEKRVDFFAVKIELFWRDAAHILNSIFRINICRLNLATIPRLMNYWLCGINVQVLFIRFFLIKLILADVVTS